MDVRARARFCMNSLFASTVFLRTASASTPTFAVTTVEAAAPAGEVPVTCATLTMPPFRMSAGLETYSAVQVIEAFTASVVAGQAIPWIFWSARTRLETTTFPEFWTTYVNVTVWPGAEMIFGAPVTVSFRPGVPLFVSEKLIGVAMPATDAVTE